MTPGRNRPGGRALPALVVMLALAVPAGAGAASPADHPAAIRLSPRVGPPSTPCTVTGRGFGSSEEVDLVLDATPVGRALTDPSGAFTTVVTVPSSVPSGPHLLRARGALSRSVATRTFLVRTDWPKFHFDLANTGFNPYENEIGPANASTLTQAWAVPAGAVDDTPTLSGGVLYAVGVTPTGGTVATAVDATSGSVRWTEEFPLWGPVSGLAYDSGALFFGTSDYVVRALDASTGAPLWARQIGGLSSNPAAAEGVVYVARNNGRVLALDSRTGHELWRSDFLGSTTYATPTVANDLVYEGSSDFTMYALDARTGTIAWTYKTGGTIGLSAAAVVGTTLYVTAQDQYLYALDALTGALRWKVSLGPPANGDAMPPAVADGVVYVSAESTLQARDASTGALLWKATDGNYQGVPVVAGGVVYLDGGAEGDFYAVDAATGVRLWTFRAGNFVGMGSIVANGMVFVGAEDRYLYAFSLPGA